MTVEQILDAIKRSNLSPAERLEIALEALRAEPEEDNYGQIVIYTNLRYASSKSDDLRYSSDESDEIVPFEDENNEEKNP